MASLEGQPFTWAAAVLLCAAVLVVEASHFRGGTISWRPLGGNTVEFEFKMGWTYDKGPGCKEHLTGQYVNQPMSGNDNNFKCQKGCAGTPVLNSVNYYCMAANQKEGWEQGQDTFNYTFPSSGPFTVGYEGNAWMQLSGGRGNGAWNVATTIDLRTRSDTGRSNTSPVALSKPLFNMQHNCNHTLRIPILDPDGDNVRCRWAVNDECLTVCNALPFARLDEQTCTLTFTTGFTQTYQPGDFFAVALTIEDFPPAPITLGGSTRKTPSDSLSSIPMQFLIKTPPYPEPCDWVPRFVSPTPQERDVVMVEEGDTLNLPLTADNGKATNVKIAKIQVLGPVGLQQSALRQEVGQVNTFTKDLTWSTGASDVGEHLVCAIPEDEKGKSGSPRCFTIKIVSPYSDIDDCKSRPCQNGATCHDQVNAFTCTCPAGYTGKTCAGDVDDCSPNPCRNGATCSDLVNDYVCACAPGYTDKNCMTDIDDCSPDPCQNGATCTDQVNDYTCTCVPGYTDKNCATDIDDCSPDPCQNGATCVDQVNDYRCVCGPGYTDKNCSTDIDDCASRPCQNGGTCVDQVNNFMCLCVPGFTDKTCSTDIDDCSPDPCQNGASCVDQVNDYRCVCVPGYTDKNCSTDIDDCASRPCQNGGTCVDQVNNFLCLCVPGFTDKTCSTDIDDCSPDPCQNGATCTDQVNDYTCTCVPGYTDKNCSTDIDDCSPDPCQNGATCTDQVNDYTCTCVPGYTDKNCSTDIDDCSPDPCQFGSTCVDQVNDYNCVCAPGYTDKNCSTDIDDCSSRPCENGALCVDQVNDYTCLCPPGYTDKNCHTDINECLPRPCMNGAVCLNHVASFTCQCAPGFTGTLCQTDINDCSPDPCQNGATCHDQLNAFTCTCPAGYTDNTCVTGTECPSSSNPRVAIAPTRHGYNNSWLIANYMDDCSPDPCQFGSTCMDQVNDYNCVCAPGYTDKNCSTDVDDCSSRPCENGALCVGREVDSYIDDCSSRPCENGALCVDQVNDYTCLCPPGYTDKNCNTGQCSLSQPTARHFAFVLINQYINECLPRPCMNGAVCLNHVASFTCQCAPGFTGMLCQTGFDFCASSPCKNGGICVNGFLGFTCSCVDGWQGLTCGYRSR
ncbi:fibropellin-1-like [Aplysia californica]|uniref:Fibropellin-1-like n=1 Tax=Aplysia californica TaxID=6500 RepID=A0ABM1VZT3_APLCA|nr:fibropellin-1-like [Aplysia californica]